MSKAPGRAPPRATIPSTKTTTAGIQSRARRIGASDARRVRAPSLTARLRARAASLSAPRVAALAHLGHELEEARLLARLGRPRGCGRSISTMSAIRPGRGDITTTRVERKTASAIECVTKTTSSRLAPRSAAARGSAARASSRRARRTARPSAGAPGRRRAPARSRRAAASRRRAATDGGPRSPSSSTSVEHLLDARARARARSQPSISSGSAMFFATVRQS